MVNFDFAGRPSDSPLVETIWRTQSEQAGTFTSVAATNCEMVVTRYQGRTTIAMRGPETKATQADCPADAEFFGIVFKLGTFMPDLPAVHLMDRKDAIMPAASSRSFWLNGSAWEFPSYDNADTFIDRLVRQGLLLRDPVVPAVLQDQQPELSIRSVRRRFLRATGLTPKVIQQIERARQAMTLLNQGVSILDTVFEAGYFDQPHLTRSLKLFMGKTPAQIAPANQSHPMSFLYKA